MTQSDTDHPESDKPDPDHPGARRRKAPLVLDVEAEALPEAPTPAAAPPPGQQEDADTRRPRRRSGRGWGLGGLLASVLGLFVAMAAGVWAADTVAAFFALNVALGWLGAGLLTTLGALVLIIAVREVRAISRISRIERLRRGFEQAEAEASGEHAGKALAALVTLYEGLATHERPVETYRRAAQDAPDPLDRVAMAERTLLAGPDREAEAAVVDAARTVATVTAFVPVAMADVVAAFLCSLRMVRRVAEGYGGHSGTFGSLRLMRAVALQLAATGAVAVADDLLGPLVGGGVLGKLSRRFGEGAMNAAMIARVGIIAIDLCRPMPFRARQRPTPSALLLRALAAWRGDA